MQSLIKCKENEFITKNVMIFQILATTVKMLLTFEFGLCISFNGIIIPALTGKSNEHNADENLTLTATEASWLGADTVILFSRTNYGLHTIFFSLFVLIFFFQILRNFFSSAKLQNSVKFSKCWNFEKNKKMHSDTIV